MNIDLADVTIHVDETLDSAGLSQLDSAFRERDGVVSVHVDEKRPHLFVLEYNPDKMTSQDLLKIVKSQGMHAELVGL
ncbi:MAG: ATP-binding protein [Pseudomonadota bacterium]